MANGKVLTYDCYDCPDASGRKPLAGEVVYPVSFRLADGSTLVIRLGQKAFDAFKHMIREMQIDDALEGTGG